MLFSIKSIPEEHIQNSDSLPRVGVLWGPWCFKSHTQICIIIAVQQLCFQSLSWIAHFLVPWWK